MRKYVAWHQFQHATLYENIGFPHSQIVSRSFLLQGAQRGFIPQYFYQFGRLQFFKV